MGKRLTAGAMLLLSAGWVGVCAIGYALAETPAGREARGGDGAAAAAELAAGHIAPATPSLFDPARHMHVSEVRAGMKGYGVSVFKGTKLERFEVEVLSVLKNFNPKYDVVLITCKGANLEHTGAIAGMSGSPIYLKDDSGRERMIGAFAYGWPLTKDPIAGVQPIEYMLTLPAESSAARDLAGRPTTSPTAGTGAAARPKAGNSAVDETIPGGGPIPHATWSWAQAKARWDRAWRPMDAAGGRPRTGTSFAGSGDAPRLQPLATPLMAAGLSPKLLEQLGPAFRASGLVPLQAGAGGSGVAEEPPAKLEPGSVLAVPLLTGDSELTAIGTCTEVLGDRVFGFGHAFNNEGPVALPMGSGRINGVVANLTTSFKLGSLTEQRGQLTADQTVGVAGRTGKAPPMVPVEVKVSYPGEQQEHTYHFQAALHPKFTPLICGVAFMSALSGTSDLPQFNTVDYAIDLEFENGRKVRVEDTAVNTSAAELFQGIGMSLTSAAENPFERVLVKKITGWAKVTPQVRQGQILEVNVPRSKYHPGETVKAFVTYKPFRSDEAILPVDLDLPRDLPQGQYQLVISDADRYVQDEQATEPFRFTAEKTTDVFDVLKEMGGIRHDALYVRLIRQPDGLAIGRTAMRQLPASRRQILLGGGRSNITPFVSSTVKIIPTDRVMAGSAEFQLTIETKTKVEGAGGGGGARGPASRPSVVPAKPDEAKPPRSGPMEKEPKEKEKAAD
jgi:hypothetical protein